MPRVYATHVTNSHCLYDDHVTFIHARRRPVTSRLTDGSRYMHSSDWVPV